MRPLLAAVTPRSWYLRKVRRPSTNGAFAGVACTSLPVGTAALVVMVGLPVRVTSRRDCQDSTTTLRLAPADGARRPISRQVGRRQPTTEQSAVRTFLSRG